MAGYYPPGGTNNRPASFPAYCRSKAPLAILDTPEKGDINALPHEQGILGRPMLIGRYSADKLSFANTFAPLQSGNMDENYQSKRVKRKWRRPYCR
jgi:hypothetical protein